MGEVHPVPEPVAPEASPTVGNHQYDHLPLGTYDQFYHQDPSTNQTAVTKSPAAGAADTGKTGHKEDYGDPPVGEDVRAAICNLRVKKGTLEKNICRLLLHITTTNLASTKTMGKKSTGRNSQVSLLKKHLLLFILLLVFPLFSGQSRKGPFHDNEACRFWRIPS